MSAWTVSKGHIDAIVQSLAVERMISFSEADAVGQDLWNENYASVNYRYCENEIAPAYAFNGVEAPLDPAIVAKQVVCYRYQSCEHPEWESSEAYRLTETLFTRLLAAMGFDSELHEDDARSYYRSTAWNAPPWGIERIDDALISR